MNTQILCIEDDQDIALAVSMVLRRAGFDVVGAADGKDGLRLFHDARPDVVLLDLGLPSLDGWEVLERIRDMSDVPVMLLTAHGLETDKVRGLSLGADDYLTKPFGNSELVARVQALLRRSRAARQEAEVYQDALVEVNFSSREVRVDGQLAALTPSEFRLLAALVRHAGQTLSAEQLLEQAWNDPMRVGPERVKFAVMRLRRKLGNGDGDGTPIEAIRGFGYRYVPPPDRRQAPPDRRQGPPDRRRPKRQGSGRLMAADPALAADPASAEVAGPGDPAAVRGPSAAT
jgi:DNA-binding response OmpR family regulator